MYIVQFTFFFYRTSSRMHLLSKLRDTCILCILHSLLIYKGNNKSFSLTVSMPANSMSRMRVITSLRERPGTISNLSSKVISRSLVPIVKSDASVSRMLLSASLTQNKGIVSVSLCPHVCFPLNKQTNYLSKSV